MKKTTSKLLKYLFIIGLFGALTFESKATHIMGSDFTYECLGNGRYKLILKIYRDCTGIGLAGTARITVASDGCGSTNITAPNTAINDVTPKCATATGPCTPQNQRAGEGIEEHVYETIINVDSAPYTNWAANGCCKLYFSWTSCCRNGGKITTGVTGSFYSYAMLDICNMKASNDTLCNNSPQLTNPPIAFACCNQPYTYNNGASDNKDFDSLSYKLTAALGTSRTNNIDPNAPLTAQAPMTTYCLPGASRPCPAIPNADPPIGFYLDPNTGDMIFTPTDCSEVGVVAIQVDEFRKDTNGDYQLVGITRRDIQVIVETCDQNNPPKLLGPYSYSICEGEELCFDVRSKDDPVIVPPPGVSQVPDTTFLSWNKGIPGATFKTKDPTVRERVGEFCWTPGIGQASSLPYNFTVTAKDQACPRPAVSIRGYSVTVKKRALGERKYDTFPCGKLVFDIDLDPQFQGIPSYLWVLKELNNTVILKTSGQKKDSFRFRRGGDYIVELTLNNTPNCPTVYLDTVTIPKFIEVELAVQDTFACENDTLELIPRIGFAKRPIIFDWTYASTGEQISTDSTIKIAPTRDTTVAIWVEDGDKCTNTDTVFIHWQQLSVPDLGPDERICTYDTFQINVPYDSLLTFRWNGVDGTGMDTTLTVNVAGNYYLDLIDSLGCVGSDTFELFVNDTVVASAGDDDIICLRQVYELTGGEELDPSFGYIWEWYDLRNNALAGVTQNLDVSPTDSTLYRLYLQITQGGVTCEDDDTMFLRVNQLPDLSTVRDPRPKCFDDGQFDLGADFPTGANFQWSEKGNSTVWYTADNPNRDTMVRNGTATPNWYYTQRFFTASMNNGDVPDPPIDQVSVHVRHNETGCEDSSSFNVRINPNPTVITQDITRCQDAGSFQLNNIVLQFPVRPASGYTWEIDSAPNGLDAATLSQILEDRGSFFFPEYWFNPMIESLPIDNALNVARLGKYKLKFTFENAVSGCRTTDSAYITVEKLPEISFTPFDRFCYSDDTVNLDDYVNLQQGRWELKSFNTNFGPGTPQYATALARMIDSTAININDDANGQGGTYNFRYVNVRTGCPVQDSIDLVVNARPQLALDELDTVCVNSGTIELNDQVTNPSLAAFLAGGPETGWVGDGLTASTFDPTSVVTPNATQALYGPFKFVATYQNPATLCINNDSIDVMVQATPSVTINNTLPFEACEGETFTLDATTERAGGGITWSTSGDGTFDDLSSLGAVYTPGADDIVNYGNTLTITTNQPDSLRNCPVATADIDIAVHAYPVFEFGAVDSGCTPVTADFSVFNITRPDLNQFSVRYDWDFGNGETSTDSAPQSIVFTDEGPYNVRVTVTNNSGNCATTEEDTLIRVFPIPVAGMASNPDYYTTVALPNFDFSSTSTLSSGEFSRYEWNFGDGSTDTGATVEYAYSDDTAEYEVSLLVISDRGCRDSTTKQIKIGPDITVFIPSAFSPDGAGPGRNNKMYVSAQGYIGYQLTIFNRWGEKLFVSNHPEDEPWDGTYQGEPAQQDVYMYVAKVIAFDGKEYEYSGTITLIR